MAIGVKETQEIIRQAAALSRNEPPLPVKLDPREAGMATGPRFRNRSLLRSGSSPDYLHASQESVDAWQKLDDDIFKFLQLRKDQFGRMADPPSHQFIAELEAQLKFGDPGYELGTYLGLVRLAADLDQTRNTHVTASEKNAFHVFRRRISEGRKEGESFDPEMVKRYRDLLETNQPATFRGLADLFRLVSRAARLPFIGNMDEVPAHSVAVMLQVMDLAARFNQSVGKPRQFQVGPMDVFLAARSVLCNRSVTQPTLSMVKELVLDKTGLYHEDLLEWLVNVGVFGSELTLHMPESLSAEGFTLQGAAYSATELVMAGGLRLARSPDRARKALATLADAILHKIQQQDGHKDRQIQVILQHFNGLIGTERRSASRISGDRQQARFDYVDAIQRAGRLAREIQAGQFASALLRSPEAAVMAEPSAAAVPDAPETDGPAPESVVTVRRFPIADYSSLLGEWDGLLTRIRKKLSIKSPIFKSMIAQLARVRSLDTCLAFGLTPGGSRCIARLGKLLQGEEAQAMLGIGPEAADMLENAFSSRHPAFLASVEALIMTLYDFKPGMRNLQFRERDRRGAHAGIRDGRETLVLREGSDLDGPVLNLVLASILTGAGGRGRDRVPRFQADGRLQFPPAEEMTSAVDGNPFLAYCAFLWVCKRGKGQSPLGDPLAALHAFAGLSQGRGRSLLRKVRELSEDALARIQLVPGLEEIRFRPGWEEGFEKGFMDDVAQVFAESGGGSGLESGLLGLLSEIQTDIDRTSDTMERDKLGMTRERVMRILE